MRKLEPFLAFLACIVGFGYLYVGELWLGVVVVFGLILTYGVLGWTGVIFQPVGIYLLFTHIALLVFLFWVLPPLIAWRKKEAPMKLYNRWYVYVVWIIGFHIVVDLWVTLNERISGFEVYSYPSRAMEPTLEPGDWMTADTWHYRKNQPRIGEVAVFSRPDGVLAKRIAGLPGDIIEIRGGVLFRNGTGIHEPYLHSQTSENPYRNVAEIKLGSDQYYMLGDFRDNSADSRLYGPIDKRQLLARAEIISFSHEGFRVRWDRFPHHLADDT